MPRKSHMLRSLVRHFLTRSRKIGTRGSGLSLAGSGRRRYRRVGGSMRRGAVHHVSVPSSNVTNVIPPSKSFFSRHKGKLATAAGLAALLGRSVLQRRDARLHMMGEGRRRRHTGGALRLAGQQGSLYGPVHVGVSKLGLTNLPQAY